MIIFRFLTFISFVIIVFWRDTSMYIDIPLLALIVAFVSFPIVYISPQKVLNPYNKLYISGPHLYMIDVIFHWLPLIYVATNRSIKKILDYEKIFLTLTFFWFYVASSNAFVLYGLDRDTGIFFLLLAILLRWIMSLSTQDV
jgi:hypothetical protein